MLYAATISLPISSDLLTALTGGIIPMVVFAYYMLMTGRMGSGRELKEKDRRIAYLEKRLDEVVDQKDLLLKEQVATTIEILHDIRKAGDAGP